MILYVQGGFKLSGGLGAKRKRNASVYTEIYVLYVL